MSITLYPYQTEAKTTVVEHIQTMLTHNEYAHALMVMATGLGKTITAAAIIHELSTLSGVTENGGGVLFLCHSTDILDHALSDMQKIPLKDMTYGMYDGNRTSAAHDVLFSTFQMMQNRKHHFDPTEFMIVIVDESHHSQAETFKEVITYFTPKVRFGMTATPDRMDEKDIRDIFGTEVVDIPLAHGIAHGWLAPAQYELVMDNLDNTVLEQLIRDAQEGKYVSVDQINKTLFIKARDEEVAHKITSYKRKGIIFCESIAHAEEFVAYLPQAAVCHSGKSKQENRDIITAFKTGELSYILTIDKFNEGVDVPDTSLLVFLRITDSRTIFFQQLGRGLRLAPHKDDVIVLDFVGNCDRLFLVKELLRDIKDARPKDTSEETDDTPHDKEVFRLSESFNVLLSSYETDILDIIERLTARKQFYATCAEASEATKRLGITGPVQYKKEYPKDSLLPSNPWRVYPDYDANTFYAGERKQFYATYAEASEATKRLGITGPVQYAKKYKKDPLLPSSPWTFYPDYDAKTFYAQKYYQTCAEASEATKRLGISGPSQYIKEYKQDPLLPSQPWRVYPDYDANTFYAGERKRFYQTCTEASEATKRLGITGRGQYRKKYPKDSFLPSNPWVFYSDYDGKTFFGKK